MTKLKKIIAKVAEDTGIPVHIVDKAYMAYWRAIKEHISSLPLKDNLSDEEFLKLRPNVNIPSIGKLSVTLDRYKNIKKSYNKIKKSRDATHKED